MYIVQIHEFRGGGPSPGLDIVASAFAHSVLQDIFQD